jgi:hypothetical protein
MFNGLYLDAVVNRWRSTKSEEDATKSRRLMEGLLLLNSISEVKGFVGRGVSTDGRSHFPMGSDDQTGPWFIGLWRFYDSGLATAEEKDRIRKHLVETTNFWAERQTRHLVLLGYIHQATEPNEAWAEVRPLVQTLRLAVENHRG